MGTEWGDLTGFRSTAEGLTDAKAARVAVVNRVERGATADQNLGARMILMAHNVEHTYADMLLEQYEQAVPDHVRQWGAEIPGLGNGVLFARILGALGHPRIATPYRWEKGSGGGAKRILIQDGEPFERSLRQLWQYAGCGDPESNPKYITGPTQEQKLRAGKRTTVRPLLYTFSSGLQRGKNRPAIADSRYYKILTEAKAAGLENFHSRECRNKKRPPMSPNGCGTVAHPEWGEPGSPWRPGHAQAHSHRIVHKEFLRDLWTISK